MSTQILIKRSSTASAVPTTSDIATGELAVNTVDKRIFTNNAGTIVELGTYPSSQAVAGNATVGGTLGVTGATTLSSGSVTGNFSVAGTLTVSTPTNSTDAASKGYVDAQVSAVIDSAPAALNTLNELAAALNDDANFATTVTNALATKLPLAGGTMTGTLTMGANKVTSTATPTSADDLTRKGYVDGLYQSTVDAEVSAAAALASETAAANSASSAASSASTATTQASAASTSATAAATSATASATSATSSANSATASATSATQSAASATQAQALVDSIESFYLGAEASAPTVDDNGDPLQAGDWYFNTTDSLTYIYNGSSWQTVSPDLVSDLTPQLGGNLDTNGNNINFGDNDKAVFGAGSDLQIYHDGSNSWISDQGTGVLAILATDLRIKNSANTKSYINGTDGGNVELYYDGAVKLATTSTGIDVTGTATMDGLMVDGNPAYYRADNSSQYVAQTFFPSGTLSDSNVGWGTGQKSGENHYTVYTWNGAAGKDRLKITNGGDISFYEDTGTTAKFFWDASAESLGIGTSSPAYPLQVGDGTNSLVTAFIRSTTTGNSRILFGDTSFADAGQISYTHTDDSMKLFTNRTERMRIDSSGNVGFSGGTNFSGSIYDATPRCYIAGGSENYIWNTAENSSANLYLVRNAGDGGSNFAYFAYGSSNVGTISTNGSSTSYNTSSDYRLKEDWQPMHGSADRVKALKPVNFAWKSTGDRVDGFLAHELAEVIPEAVTGTKDAMRTEEYEVSPAVLDDEGNVVTEAVMGTREVPDYQGIDQSKLVPLLTAALQEALTEIDNLKARLDAAGL